MADEIYDRKEKSCQFYSTSGDYDLLAKIYIPDGRYAGLFLNEQLFIIPGISRTLTTMTLKCF